MTEVNVENTQPEGGEGGEDNPGNIRKATTQSILKAASNATGMEFASVEDMMSALARLGAQQLVQNNPQAVQPQSQSAPKPGRPPKTDLEDQFKQLKEELAQKEAKLVEAQIMGDIKGALGDSWDPQFLEWGATKIRNQIQLVDGQPRVMDDSGRIRYTSDGRPMTVAELGGELARANPKLLKNQPGGPGSGIRPDGSWTTVPGGDEDVPDYSVDPARFNAWANSRGLGRGSGLKGVRATVTNSSPKR